MPEEIEKVAIVGGGAAGFFAAITCAQANPKLQVYLFEKTPKLLSKVRVSGGGRCNVTHHCFNPNQLIQFYPRGSKFLKPSFKIFGATETVTWFAKRGVQLKTEADGRMFPVTDDSGTIVNCLLNEARKAGVIIQTSTAVNAVSVSNTTQPGFNLQLFSGTALHVNKLLIATGGSAKPEGYSWLKALGHNIIPPVPSLSTFNTPDSGLKDLPGISVKQAKVKIAGHNLENEGPLLITHWGFSGPAVLKLSAWGARTLHDFNYQFTALINWVPEYSEEKLREYLANYRQQYPKRVVMSNPLFNLPQRLWKALVQLVQISEQTIWAELPGKNQNKLIEQLLRGPFAVRGKTTFKEEFVTCGGVDTSEVNAETLESRKVPGLFFAGEVLDIDGVTGGFNFQAAWTTGFLAGRAMAKE